MPIVPFERQEPEAPAMPKVEPKFLAMAAAMMHSEGRLFKPEEPAAEPPKDAA